MKEIEQSYEPRRLKLSLVFVLLLVFELLLGGLLGGFIDKLAPWQSTLLFGLWLAGLLLSTLAFGVLLATRLRIRSDGSSFDVAISFFKRTVKHRNVIGQSWQAISRLGRSTDGGAHGPGTYRVDVSTKKGDRVTVLGTFLCWLYGVECR